MIHISTVKSIKKILVDDALDAKKDINLLYNEIVISQKDAQLLEIIFIDIRMIPTLIIKELYKNRQKIKIVTTQRSLWLYLSKFGIKNEYKNNFKQNENSLNTGKPIEALVFGGSAGGLKKIKEIIETLPYSDLSIFVVVHITPKHKTMMSQILQAITNYTVLEAKHNMKIEKNHIYTVTPDNHLVVSDGYIYLNKNAKVTFSRPSIDVAFKSLAYEYQDGLVAVLVCGYGKDGSDSLQELKNYNSRIIIEDPSECDAKDMLINAIDTQNYTKIFNLNQIKSYINSLISSNHIYEDELNSFIDKLYLIYGYDFRNYDKSSIQRRVELIMEQNDIINFSEFSQEVFDDDKLLAKLLRGFSINTTEFFRDSQVYKNIISDVLPQLSKLSHIRVWSAACSRGDEPYSIAIMLDEAGLLEKSTIYATDFNTTVLAKAKNGLYNKNEFLQFKENYIKSGGKKDFEDWFDISDDFVQIKKYIQDKILFFKHNLATDSTINEFDIIFCRNVLIYFDTILQKKVFDTLDNSLFANGYLVLGCSEMLPKQYNYEIVTNIEHNIYKKRGS